MFICKSEDNFGVITVGRGSRKSEAVQNYELSCLGEPNFIPIPKEDDEYSPTN